MGQAWSQAQGCEKWRPQNLGGVQPPWRLRWVPRRMAEVWNGDQEGLGKEIIGSQKLGTHRVGGEPALGPMVVDAGSHLESNGGLQSCLMTTRGRSSTALLGSSDFPGNLWYRQVAGVSTLLTSASDSGNLRSLRRVQTWEV